MSETIAINDVEYIEELYPRFEVDDKRVQQYQNSLEHLPPIEVSQEHKLIDGYHRLRAHRQAGENKIEAEIVEVENDNELFRLAVEANADHGLQLSNQEKKEIAREWVKSENGVSNGEVAKVLSVSDSTVSNWTRDIKEQKREERRDKSLRCYLDYLSYSTMADVGDKLDVSKKTVDNDLCKKSKSGEITQQFDFIKVDNVWRFQHPDSEFGAEGYPGRIPGQIVGNFLYHYTDEFDLVVDPMAGGGTTVDVCKRFNRRYAAFDINPLEDKGIRHHDVTDDMPIDSSKADAVFFDPPYWRLKDDDYVEGSISAETYSEWLELVGDLFSEFDRICKNGSTVGMILQSMYDDKESGDFLDLPFDVNQLAQKEGWEQQQRISTPMTHGMKSNHAVQHAKDNGYLLDLNRDLVVWEI